MALNEMKRFEHYITKELQRNIWVKSNVRKSFTIKFKNIS